MSKCLKINVLLCASVGFMGLAQIEKDAFSSLLYP